MAVVSPRVGSANPYKYGDQLAKDHKVVVVALK